MSLPRVDDLFTCLLPTKRVYGPDRRKESSDNVCLSVSMEATLHCRIVSEGHPYFRTRLTLTTSLAPWSRWSPRDTLEPVRQETRSHQSRYFTPLLSGDGNVWIRVSVTIDPRVQDPEGPHSPRIRGRVSSKFQSEIDGRVISPTTYDVSSEGTGGGVWTFCFPVLFLSVSTQRPTLGVRRSKTKFFLGTLSWVRDSSDTGVAVVFG